MLKNIFKNDFQLTKKKNCFYPSKITLEHIFNLFMINFFLRDLL